ncbi:glycoside hydrolase family 9 protein [Maribacter sp. HTCC2170]|uniref:glycoside hydrolase family 9 protein n=1 Tax=Maribacter sp. (strain HTCC2170 / KCCM 42371) TaxID=313603 RepID=UPI00006B49BC|nr:glycoside hydrolase family 9 protein [Maribacter sp. HTCC2170]EAR01059.1 cellulase [Maribacter sp. HTCC2170]
MRNKVLGVGLLTLLIIGLCIGCAGKQFPPDDNEYSDQIRLNQIGYYPNAVKKAVIVEVKGATDFSIVDRKTMYSVFEGKLSEQISWELSGEKVQIANFSDLTKTGKYILYIDCLGYSYPFEIRNNVLDQVFLGSVKAMYYQRMSTPLEEEFAGKWHRPMAHPDDNVSYHPSSGRNEGFLNSPGGWYDAGDYNKYVVNGSFPLGQFLSFHEQYPNTLKDNSLNIPESGNGTSDYLDELKYEMDWLLTMQDDDGGLFHKLTALNFQGMVMPHEATAKRYVVGKGTAASLDFSACAAKAYRVFKEIDANYAHKCLEASKRAYAWALENPDVEYLNPEIVSTGQYGDKDFLDEWFWANAELYISTGENEYLKKLTESDFNFEFVPGDNWTKFMRFMGMFALLDNKETLSSQIFESLKKGIILEADKLVERSNSLAYFQPLDDFQWGSNSDVLNAAIIIANAYRLNPKPDYLIAVQQAADYVLGANATGFSFVTGYGHKTPMFIHHRQSEADGIDEPIPGLIAGGPNFGKQDVADGVVYPENAPPMKSWVDQEPSYASNEICINWNSPLSYILGFLENESK